MNTNNGSRAAVIWAILEDVARGQKETDQLLEKIARRQEETARRQKETDRQMKETDRRLSKQFGDMGNRFGEVIEHMFAPGLQDKFQALGYKFDQVHRNSKIRNAVTKQRIAEIDVFLTDGKYDMAVEVKVNPNKKDVDEHVTRVKKIRTYYDSTNNDRKILGAIAGAVFDDTVRNYAIENGFYAVSQSGDTVSINVPEGFIPREW